MQDIIYWKIFFVITGEGYPFEIKIIMLWSPSLSLRAPVVCHCEHHEVVRGNLSFGVSSFSFVLSLGTRDCHVGTKTVPPRNDGWGNTARWVSLLRGPRAPKSLIIASLLLPRHCEPAKQAWQSRFWVSSFSFVWSFGTRDCFVVPLALLAMTDGGCTGSSQ